MKRPLVCFTLCFCSGIFIANLLKSPLVLVCLLSTLFFASLALYITKALRFDILILFLAFLLGALFLKNSQAIPKSHISNYNGYKNEEPYLIRGFIAAQPTVKNNQTCFIYKTEGIQLGRLSHGCSGSILVRLKGKKDLFYGEELILKGNLTRPFYFSRPSRNYRDYLYRQGIYSVMYVGSQNCVIRLNKNKGLILKKLSLWLKSKMEGVITKYVSSLAAGILEAMILGDKTNIPTFLNDSMIKSGTIHILVVSGFNVGIVAFIVVLFLKLLRLPRLMRIFMAVGLLLIYCLITGASNPVLRSTIMALVFILAYLFKREPDIYNSLSLAAIFILSLNPQQLFDAGFQLSFASVFSIIYLYPKIKLWLRVDKIVLKYLRYIIDSLLVSLSAWLGTMGLIAYYFRIFSPVTVLANLFIVPLATLITLCGFSLVALGSILPALAPFFAVACEFLVSILIYINTFLVKIPGAYCYLAQI